MTIKPLLKKDVFDTLKVPLFAFLAAVAVVSVLIFLSSKNPIEALVSFFTSPFSASYYFGSWLNSATLLTFAAVGMCISFRSGCFNLGGEGQVCLGGFVAAVTLNLLKGHNNVLALSVSFLAAVISSGLLGLFSGILKAYRNINELLISFLLSSAILPLVDYAVSGPLRDTKGTLLATPFIDKAFRLKSLLKPSTLNSSIFIAVAFSVLLGLFLFYTKSGYRLICTGKAPEFSDYCGFNTKKISVSSMFFSSMAHGLSGFFAVVGTYYTCHAGFYAGMGWNALSVSLIAKTNPFMVFPASLLLAYIFTAADCAVLENNMNFNSAFLVQGVVLFVVSAQFLVKSLNNAKERIH